MITVKVKNRAEWRAWLFTDQEGYFISESSVYRILKRFDLIESPVLR